jgi:hypothetical protein
MASTIGDFGHGHVVNRQFFSGRPISITRNLLMMPLTSEISLLHDASSIALDVSTVVISNTAWLRLCNVIGRVVILSADYIQGDGISPVEWVFQTTMLVIAARLFIQSAWPLMMAALLTSSLSVRDRRAYALLFRTVGLTILQFKTLLASRTLDWIEYLPNESVELTGEYIYFLYSGDVTTPVTSNKTGTSNDVVGGADITHTSCVSDRIFGDIQFAKVLETSVYNRARKNIKSDRKSRNQENSSSREASPSSCVVGSNGASVLRIFTPKLLKLMENDDELSITIQRLVLLCMQKKLSSALRDVGLRSTAKGNRTS